MEASGKLKVSSTHIFYKGFTENYMDYTWQKGGGNNKHKGKMYSLYKWQWEIMRKDERLIKNY